MSTHDKKPLSVEARKEMLRQAMRNSHSGATVTPSVLDPLKRPGKPHLTPERDNNKRIAIERFPVEPPEDYHTLENDREKLDALLAVLESSKRRYPPELGETTISNIVFYPEIHGFSPCIVLSQFRLLLEKR